MNNPETTTYGQDPTADPLVECGQLAHAIEISYPWTPKDVVRVLDRATSEMRNLRCEVNELRRHLGLAPKVAEQ